MKFHPTPQVPALQYVGGIDPGGSADQAGLKEGDFILEVRTWCNRHRQLWQVGQWPHKYLSI